MLSSGLMLGDRDRQTKPPSSFGTALTNAAMSTSFKLDEGYSEETRSQSESDAATTSPSKTADMSLSAQELGLPGWITSLGEPERSELAYIILRTLRTSSIAAIVERLHPLLHLDPVTFLPPEIIFQVFSFLTPRTLLVASATSRTWRARALDSRLWRRLYIDEGWAAEHREIRKFEAERLISADSDRKARMTRAAADGSGDEERSRKRVPRDGFPTDGDARQIHGGPESSSQAGLGALGWREQHGGVEADEGPGSGSLSRAHSASEVHDEEMRDVLPQEPASMWHSDSAIPRPGGAQDINMNGESLEPTRRPPPRPLLRRRTTSSATSRTARSSSWSQSRLTLASLRGEKKLDWQHLFKQRRRLEENWNAGRFITFQLPHPNHPEDAHKECVYTIQYSGKYLVSGSRDKTIRIWDLNTQRLVRGPLHGHAGSVLCLQFDASEDEDVIISGSSDTDVIVWRFSTGEQIKKIRQAHSESVLNLKFDRRYLVTCSKDKTINVWSRRQLEMTDDDFPSGAATSRARHVVIPQMILNLAGQLSLVNEGRLLSSLRPEPVPAYSLLMSLRGHNAAVNAIQVSGDQVVSASGDRTIKIWNVRTGQCEKTIPGHQKGIACVQYDGRRIVSGSSDNTVKIFDRSGAEVACLQGHQFLVRTVQAGFGDIPGSEDDERAEARAIDQEFLDAFNGGRIANSQSTRHDKSRNAGSRDPEKITAFGAALPPGGGGSRWGRIVSGSYDETIIIWKRDSEGKWVISHRLRQEEAARAASLRTSIRPPPQQQPQPSAADHTGPATHAQAQFGPFNQQVPHAGPANFSTNAPNAFSVAALQHQQQPGGSINAATAAAGPQQGNAAMQQLLHQHQNGGSSQAHHQHATAVPAWAYAGVFHHNGQAHAPTPQQIMQMAAHQGQTTQYFAGHANQPVAATAAAATAIALNPATAAAGAAPTPAPAPAAAAATAAAAVVAAAAGAAANAPNNNNNNNNNGNARVFKLQFDARRIICCSQDPRIVGWDFANDDDAIIEASRFFQGL